MAVPVALLAATGVVGQKVIHLFDKHPEFQITELISSEKNQGMKYQDVVNWQEKQEIPENIKNLVLKSADQIEAKYVISSLPADVARVIEPKLAEKGKHIISNASAMRMNPDVPLIIPELNFEHLDLIRKQKSSGKIITNPNCTTVFTALALAPLKELAEVEHVSVVTLQAISGAGFSGLYSTEIMGNVIPYIEQEEEKIATETKKILGEIDSPADFEMTINVNRVAVLHGHTVILHIQFAKEITPEMAYQNYLSWNKKHPDLFEIYREGYPTPLRNITDDDQRTHIARIRSSEKKNMLTVVAMGHNLVRGAAGAALLNLEKSYQILENL